MPKFTFGARSSRQRPASQRGERGTPRDGNWSRAESQTCQSRLMRRHNRIYMKNGPLAQLVERLHGMQKVTGSNPVRSTHWASSSAGRTLHSHCRGKRFESALVHSRLSVGISNSQFLIIGLWKRIYQKISEDIDSFIMAFSCILLLTKKSSIIRLIR